VRLCDTIAIDKDDVMLSKMQVLSRRKVRGYGSIDAPVCWDDAWKFVNDARVAMR
jgi:hypothetical protein